MQMLGKLAYMSQEVGKRTDYVQGGGGNTSVKLPGGLMAIKASGFRLSQVTESDGFAVIETSTLKDVTAEQGYKPLRPSVEVGFHALLGTFVLHTHPVYACLALCAQGGQQVIETVMAKLPYKYIYVPYINPGAELSAYIQQKLSPGVQVVFMQSHGLVVTGDQPEECIRIHEEVNLAIGAHYGVTPDDFEAHQKEIAKPLYPDHMVYLTLTPTQAEILAAITFIQETLHKNGQKAQSMDAAAQSFIAGWESEAYRKTILS